MTTPGDASLRAAPDRSGDRRRMPGLDALRSGALLLGIVLHALMGFIVLPASATADASTAAETSWLIIDQDPRGYALPMVVVIHLFRLTVFFVLSGYFGHLVVSRRGMPRYLKERTIRIALPVFACWPFAVLPLGVIAAAWGERNGAEMSARAASNGFPVGQLWFLWVLFQCCLLLAGLRALARRFAPQHTRRAADRCGAVLAGPWGVPVMAVPYLLAVVWQAKDYAGISEPSTLAPEPSSLVAYFSAFVAGWLLWHRAGAMTELAAHWRWQMGLAVVGTVGLLHLLGLLGLPAPDGDWRHPTAVVAAVTAWAWTFGLLGLCVQHLRAERPQIRYLADASYWMYLLHLPLLVGIGALLTSAPIPAEVKLTGTLAVTTLILLLSYDGFVRSTWIGKWLNGHRRDRVIFARRTRQVDSGAAVD